MKDNLIKHAWEAFDQAVAREDKYATTLTARPEQKARMARRAIEHALDRAVALEADAVEMPAAHAA